MFLLRILFVLPLVFGSTFLLAVTTSPIDHTQWDQLLKKHVNKEGDVNYKGFFSRIFGKKNRTKRLVEFIDPYVEVQLNKDTKVEYMDYIWTLNEQ